MNERMILRRSHVVFMASCLFTGSIISGVYSIEESNVERMRQNVIRDIELEENKKNRDLESKSKDSEGNGETECEGDICDLRQSRIIN